LAERAYPEDPAYVNKTRYYDALIERYEFGKKYTAGKTVLDIPCGTGWGTSLIDNAKEIYGVDISSEAIQYAQSHFKATFSEGSMHNLSFKENSFDIALCFEGIEHISREAGIVFFNEIKRVVKNDGLIIGSVPVLDKEGKDTGNPFHIFEYPEDYLMIILKENFEVIEYDKKKGGDGPIAYFVLKNNLKNKKTILISANICENDFLKEINRHLYRDFHNDSVIIINTDPSDRIEKILQGIPDSRCKIVKYEFKPSTSQNRIEWMGCKIKALVRELVMWFKSNISKIF
jgi:ubiquinone/menaquinone biosynthesis C-methylase UbiE